MKDEGALPLELPVRTCQPLTRQIEYYVLSQQNQMNRFRL
ncbi:hypothetical protein LNTAR_24094 [Lentisphaera araneosa HTCC2155]|uniref:Uncharacterized protein n=1 Tax=Lentisphaera araneosa HTCC2155 TaxID=313628 RepID=A6DQ07_9BACT|nr:hypothetical protein LNTAR_24094 [Lentisphaera araneosa HTCC2155]